MCSPRDARRRRSTCPLPRRYRCSVTDQPSTPHSPASVQIQRDNIYQKGYWSRPEILPSKVGDKSEINIFLAVGMALSEWEWVEEELAKLFSVLVSDNIRGPSVSALRAFGSVESSSNRINMIKSASEVYFNPEDWERKEIKTGFEKFIGAVRGASHRRNEIAHGHTMSIQLHRGNEFDPPTINGGHFLIAPDYMTGRNSAWPSYSNEDAFGITRSQYRYSSENILEFCKKFTQLKLEVIQYTHMMSKNEAGIPRILFKLLTGQAEIPPKGN